MFVKHGDGKIVSVLDEEELTDEQKKKLKDFSKNGKKSSKEDKFDSDSQNKTSGR
jgi:hypothetical protein